jgi:hypothetical protein
MINPQPETAVPRDAEAYLALGDVCTVDIGSGCPS